MQATDVIGYLLCSVWVYLYGQGQRWTSLRSSCRRVGRGVHLCGAVGAAEVPLYYTACGDWVKGLKFEKKTFRLLIKLSKHKVMSIRVRVLRSCQSSIYRCVRTIAIHRYMWGLLTSKIWRRPSKFTKWVYRIILIQYTNLLIENVTQRNMISFRQVHLNVTCIWEGCQALTSSHK